MALLAEDSFGIKKDLRSLSRSPVLRNPRCAEAAIQAIEQARRRSAPECGSGNGRSGVRVKIVVTKQELRQMAALMGWGRGGTGRCRSGLATLDQVMHLLRRRHARRVEDSGGGKWRPALQSIPEEF